LKIKGDGRRMALKAVNEELSAKSGYIIPHSVIAGPHGRVAITMIGSASEITQPGAIFQVNDRTGTSEDFFGRGPARDPDDLGPKYMYDFDARGRDQSRHQLHIWTTGTLRRRNRTNVSG
jgi:hypothetical protein